MNDFHELFKRYVSSEQISWDKIGRLPAELVSIPASNCVLVCMIIMCVNIKLSNCQYPTQVHYISQDIYIYKYLKVYIYIMYS